MTQATVFAQKLLGPTVYTPKALIKYIGRTPAALLQQLHYSLQTTTFTEYGKRWVSRTLESWAEILECSTKTIQRAFDRLESFGLVISDRLHRHQYNQRKSYRVDYEALEALLADETNRLDLPRQAVSIDVDILSGSNNKNLNTDLKKQQTEAVIPDHSTSIPTHHPVSEIDKEKILVEAVEYGKPIEDDPPESSPPSPEAAELDPELEQEIVETVGHRISAGLRLLVMNASSEVIKDAMKVVKTGKNIKNKAGLFRSAIEKQWKPGAAAADVETKFVLDPDFNEWWDAAKSLGLVMGSEMKHNQLWIYAAPNGEPQLYEEMRSIFSMSWLRRRISKR